jgi:hypothetical protein
MDAVSLTDAKAHLSELVDRVEAGDSIDITRLFLNYAMQASIRTVRLHFAQPAHLKKGPPGWTTAGPRH